MTSRLQMVCDQCYEEKLYDGSDPHDEATEDGWLVVTERGDVDEFCSRECVSRFYA